jgi:ParB family chromosome partitioning protein
VQVPLDTIIVKKRIRKDMGNLDALADSMSRIGQISPVVLDEGNILLAGGRRLAAAKLLGWRTINAVITHLPPGVSGLEFEIEENNQRSDFTREETETAMKKLYRQKNPDFFRRIWNAVVRFFKKLFLKQH